MNDVLLVCDPPPGPRWVLSSDRDIIDTEATLIREAWHDWITSSSDLLILPAGYEVSVFPGRYEWPDAEFCAA